MFFVPFQDTLAHLVYFVRIPLPPLPMRNGFPLSLPTLLLTYFALLHITQRITIMIPSYPQLVHPQMMTYDDDDDDFIFFACSTIVIGRSNSYSKTTCIFENGDIGTTTTRGL